jgi:hypothetical protein
MVTKTPTDDSPCINQSDATPGSDAWQPYATDAVFVTSYSTLGVLLALTFFNPSG